MPIRKLTTGRYQADFQYWAAGVPRTKRNFKTQEEAERWLALMEAHAQAAVIPELKHPVVFPVGIQLLTEAAKVVETDYREAKRLLERARRAVIPAEAGIFFELYKVIEAHAECAEILRRESAWWNELEINGIQRRFAERVGQLIPGAKIMSTFRHNRYHRPDFFVEVDGQIRVVEVKKKVIDKSALRQVLRYINIYKVDLGYAVAPECAVELPKNVRFVRCD